MVSEDYKALAMSCSDLEIRDFIRSGYTNKRPVAANQKANRGQAKQQRNHRRQVVDDASRSPHRRILPPIILSEGLGRG